MILVFAVASIPSHAGSWRDSDIRLLVILINSVMLCVINFK